MRATRRVTLLASFALCATARAAAPPITLEIDAREKVDGPDNLSLSLGIWVKSDGSVTDVRHGSPAFAAGMVPDSRVLAIGGHKWSADFARETLVKAEKSSDPIELVVETGDLVRDDSQPDRLSEILAPKAR